MLLKCLWTKNNASYGLSKIRYARPTTCAVQANQTVSRKYMNIREFAILALTMVASISLSSPQYGLYIVRLSRNNFRIITAYS